MSTLRVYKIDTNINILYNCQPFLITFIALIGFIIIKNIQVNVHSTHDYYIGQCRVVCNPYGYFGYETTLESKDYFGKRLELDIDSQGQITGIHG